MPVNFLPLAPGAAGRVVPLMARLYGHDATRFDAERANRVTNKAAADRILRHWASRLVKGLDAASGKEAS